MRLLMIEFITRCCLFWVGGCLGWFGFVTCCVCYVLFAYEWIWVGWVLFCWFRLFVLSWMVVVWLSGYLLYLCLRY